jgi:acetyl esterase/lipase
MAKATGMRVISIDYTLAPQAKWRRLMEQVTGVYKTLLESGITPNGVGIYGDSAGGSIAAGMVLKLRDEGIAMPGALLLWSPWSDVSMIGDTYQTLADWDPLLTVDGLIASAAAYAIPAEQKTPYASPVYGNYSKGFPITLIQCGTREMFLSNCVCQISSDPRCRRQGRTRSL